MKRTVIVLIVLGTALLLAGCAAGPNALVGSADDEGRLAGFWLGIWHGVIAPVTFVISLFSERVHLYEVHNNGGWYNFGFMIGLWISVAGPAGAGPASGVTDPASEGIPGVGGPPAVVAVCRALADHRSAGRARRLASLKGHLQPRVAVFRPLHRSRRQGQWVLVVIACSFLLQSPALSRVVWIIQKRLY